MEKTVDNEIVKTYQKTLNDEPIEDSLNLKQNLENIIWEIVKNSITKFGKIFNKENMSKVKNSRFTNWCKQVIKILLRINTENDTRLIV